MTKLAYEATRCRSACEHVARQIVRPLVTRYYMSNALATRAKSDGSIVTDATKPSSARFVLSSIMRFPTDRIRPIQTVRDFTRALRPASLRQFSISASSASSDSQTTSGVPRKILPVVPSSVIVSPSESRVPFTVARSGDYSVLLGHAGRRCEAEVSHRSEPV